jgi:hypothetical protein
MKVVALGSQSGVEFPTRPSFAPSKLPGATLMGVPHNFLNGRAAMAAAGLCTLIVRFHGAA